MIKTSIAASTFVLMVSMSACVAEKAADAQPGDYEREHGLSGKTLSDADAEAA